MAHLRTTGFGPRVAGGEWPGLRRVAVRLLIGSIWPIPDRQLPGTSSRYLPFAKISGRRLQALRATRMLDDIVSERVGHVLQIGATALSLLMANYSLSAAGCSVQKADTVVGHGMKTHKEYLKRFRLHIVIVGSIMLRGKRGYRNFALACGDRSSVVEEPSRNGSWVTVV